MTISTMTITIAVKRKDVGPGECLRSAVGSRRMHGDVLATDVVKLRCRALLGPANGHLVLGDGLRNFGCRIIEVTGQDSVLGAHHDAGGLESEIYFMRAIVTFCSRAGFRIYIDGVIRASLHTGLASNADIRIEFHDAIVALVHGRNGTDTYTGRIGAVVAPRHLKRSGDIGILPGLYTFDPGALHAEGYLVLAFARGRAGMTPDTGIVVNQKTVIHTDANSICKKPCRATKTCDPSMILDPDTDEADAHEGQSRTSCNDRLLHLGQKVQIPRAINVDQFAFRNVHECDAQRVQ